MTLRLLFTLVISGFLGFPALSQDLPTPDYSPLATADYAIASKGYPRLLFDPTGTRLAMCVRPSTVEDGGVNKEVGRIVFLNVPDLEVIREIRTDTEPYSASFSPNGEFFALSLARATDKGNLRFAILSTLDWKPVHSERNLNYAVSSLIFDPIGDLLYVGGSDHREILRFEVGTWNREGIPALQSVTSGCQSLAVSPDGKFGALGTGEATLYVWPLDDRSEAKALGTQQFKGILSAVTFNGDSTLLAAGDSRGTVMVFYRTSDDLWAWKSELRLPSGGVTGVAFLRDNSLATTSTYGDVARWNIENPAVPVETMNLGSGNAEALAVDSRYRFMAVAGGKVFLFPLGVSEPYAEAEYAEAEIPAPPMAIVGKTTPEVVEEQVAALPPVSESSPTQSTPPIPTSSSQETGNLMIWMAASADAGGGNTWIQAWAAGIDNGRYNPLQLVLPSENLNRAVMKSNLAYMEKILKKDDFLTFYISGVLCKKEEGKDFEIAIGPYLNERISLTEWLTALSSATKVAPVIWFLDLRLEPGADEAASASSVEELALKIALTDTKAKRPDIGVGLLVLSPQGSYNDMAANLKDALLGKADDNKDGILYDRELLLYLGERCHTATRVQVIGDAQNEIPVLPNFQLIPR